MDFEPFGVGLSPDGLRDTYEIKILICYLLTTVGGSMTSDQIGEVFQQSGVVNYFDFIKARDDLLRTAHMADCDGLLSVTELGRSVAENLKRSLPRSVRDKVVAHTMQLRARLKLEGENEVSIRHVEDGVVVSLRMRDIGTDLLTLDLFLADEMQAEMVRQRFLGDPTLFYKGVFALLTGDLEAVGGLVTPEGPAL